MLEAAEKIQLNIVTYSGGQSSLVSDLLANRLNYAVLSPPVALSHIQAGKLVALAITSPDRSPLLPDVPSTTELGYPRVTVRAWSGVLMPAGVSPAIVSKANAALHAAAQDPEVVATLGRQGFAVAAPTTPEAFATALRNEVAEWPKIFELAKIRRQE